VVVNYRLLKSSQTSAARWLRRHPRGERLLGGVFFAILRRMTTATRVPVILDLSGMPPPSQEFAASDSADVILVDDASTARVFADRGCSVVRIPRGGTLRSQVARRLRALEEILPPVLDATAAAARPSLFVRVAEAMGALKQLVRAPGNRRTP
jgi:hypothetical protein